MFPLSEIASGIYSVPDLISVGSACTIIRRVGRWFFAPFLVFIIIIIIWILILGYHDNWHRARIYSFFNTDLFLKSWSRFGERTGSLTTLPCDRAAVRSGRRERLRASFERRISGSNGIQQNNTRVHHKKSRVKLQTTNRVRNYYRKHKTLRSCHTKYQCRIFL